MKKILLLTLFIALFVNVSASDLKSLNKEIIEEGNLSKKEYWINLKSWISSNYARYDRVVDMEDAEAGTLVLKTTTSIPVKSVLLYNNQGDFLLDFSVKIDCRDNKFRITVTDVCESFKVAKGIDYSLYSSESLTKISSELELIVHMSKEYFDGEAKWHIDENFCKVHDEIAETVNMFKNSLSELDQKNRNQKKEYNATKIALSMYERQYDLISDIYDLSNTSVNEFIDNLISKMNIKDDF